MRVFVWVALLFLFSGCEFPQDLPGLIQFIQNRWNSPGENSHPSESSSAPVPSPSLSLEEFTSAAAKTAKANAEILHEILFVIFMREPKDRGEFGNWADTLNQGASLEGVYNGLTHSSDYRRLESTHAGASPEAIRAFGEELAYLESELPVPTQFDAISASPLPSTAVQEPVNTSLEIDSPRVAAEGLSSKSPKPADISVLSEKYSKQFVGSSIFTLKRVLGDEALKIILVKSDYREKLAKWYAKWVVRISQRNVDFGLALRNNPDEAFHYKWAIQSTEDRIRWEILNRIHRVLNEANRQKQ